MKNLLHILFKVSYGVLWFVFFSVIWIIMGMWVMSPIAFLIMLTVIYYPFLPDIPFCLYSFLMGVVVLLWCCYVIGAYNTYGGFSTPLRVLCRICESVVFYSSYVVGAATTLLAGGIAIGMTIAGNLPTISDAAYQNIAKGLVLKAWSGAGIKSGKAKAYYDSKNWKADYKFEVGTDTTVTADYDGKIEIVKVKVII